MGQLWAKPEETRRTTRSRHHRSYHEGSRLSKITVHEVYEGSDEDEEESDVPELEYRPSRSTLRKRGYRPLSEISENSQQYSDIAAAGAAAAIGAAAKRSAQDQKKRAQTVHPRRLREDTKTPKIETRRRKQEQHIDVKSTTRRRTTRPNTHHTTRRRSQSPRPQQRHIRPDHYHDYAPKPRHHSDNDDDNKSLVSTITSSRHPVKECIICTDTRSLRHFPHRSPTSTCTHPANICKRCLKHWITTQFTTKLWDQIICPECPSLLTYPDIRDFSSRDTFRRYDILSTRAALESIPGFAWCMAKGCTSGQVVDESASSPKFTCVACKASHCVAHGVRWHRGETCAQYDYRTDSSIRKKEDEASRRLIREVAKKCPNGKCKWSIEKNDGCDHMTCTKCKHQFCWVCLAAYKPIRDQGNHMHRADCMHYAPPA